MYCRGVPGVGPSREPRRGEHPTFAVQEHAGNPSTLNFGVRGSCLMLHLCPPSTAPPHPLHPPFAEYPG